ncbi:MAG: hypothetical protein PVG39_00890 [Desulfobacteraceae bacterium]|jgi:hypothetical protein
MAQIPETLQRSINLPRFYTPEQVMADPDRLRLKIVDYFSLLKDEDDPQLPTPPGLAMAIGLRGFDALQRIIRAEEDVPGTYMKESMACLELAGSFIEDAYIQGGLREAMPQQFVKFLLSTFFNRREKAQVDVNADMVFKIEIEGISNRKNPTIIDVTPGKKDIKELDFKTKEIEGFDDLI